MTCQISQITKLSDLRITNQELELNKQLKDSEMNQDEEPLLSDFLEELKTYKEGAFLDKTISIFYNDWSLNPDYEDDYSERVDILTIKLKDIEPKEYKVYTVMWWDQSIYVSNFVEICVKKKNRDIPKINEIYRHFKGNCYKIIAVGHHSETKEKMVIYYDLSCKNSSVKDPCIRPLDMFMSEVDHEKYPDVKQKYRFERV